ncbi:MAG: hypothetical protein ACJARD_000223 [Alphaproteobacteria bacterium]
MKRILYSSKFNSSHSILKEPKFVGTIALNQPKTALYKSKPPPAIWFQKGLLTSIVGATGYLNLANKYGHGFFHTPLDYKTVPKIIDRSSPAMWV